MIRRLLAEAAEAIGAIGAGNPRFEAELLLAHALDRPRVFLFTHPEYEPSTRERERFEHLLERRLRSEPLQYVLGSAPFRSLTLRVHPGVLIPRSETELLVDHAMGALARWRARHADPCPWVIDVGVGSGAILLGMMHEERDGFRPLGIDIARPAVELTAENAKTHGLPVPSLLLGDVLTPIDPSAPVAGIVSNPPYVATAEMEELPAEIREYEPHEALHAGRDGLGVIRLLLDQARPFLDRGAWLCFEIGGMQEGPVRDELRDRGLLAHATVFPDLAKRPRVVLIEDVPG